MKIIPLAFAVLFFSACVHSADAPKSERIGAYSYGSIDSALVLSLHADGTYEEVFFGGFVALREGETYHGPPKEVRDRGRWEERADRIILRGGKASRTLKISSREGRIALEESVSGGFIRRYIRSKEEPNQASEPTAPSGRGSP